MQISRSVPAAAAPRQSRVGVAASINLLAGLSFTLIFLYFSVRARFRIPYVDDWDWLASLQNQPWRALWQPHNEHIIVLPRLLVWMDFWIWGWPGYATLIAALLSHAAVSVVLIRACGNRPRDEGRLLTGTVLVLMFLTYNLQGTVFAAAVNFPLVSAFGVLAIAGVSYCAWNAESPSRGWWLVFSAVMSVLAMICLTNGLMVPFIVAGLVLILRLPRTAVAGFLFLGVLGVAARTVLGGVPGSMLRGSGPAVVEFALAILAGPLASVSPSLAVGFGCVFMVLSVWVLWQFVRAPVHDGMRPLLVGILWFAVASCGMAALGRAQFDLSVAAESRYAELAVIGWVCLLLLLLPPGVMNGRTGRAAGYVLTGGAVALLPLQIFVGRVWAAKADHLEMAGLVLTTAVPDQDWIQRFHPLGASYIDSVLPQLLARDVGFLRFPERGRLVPRATEPGVCEGRLEAIDPVDVSPGLRVRGHLQERGAALRILDRERRTQGLARPASHVQFPRATPNDFVWTELEVLTGRLDVTGDWMGISAWGAGPPFSADLLDEERQVICTAPITCCTAPPALTERPEIVLRGNLPEGFLDHADCSSVGGWAWDPGRPMRSLDVRLMIDNRTEIVETASQFRQDLKDAGKGNGEHGFRVSTVSLGLNPGTWQVSASIASTGVPLAGSPKTVTCP